MSANCSSIVFVHGLGGHPRETWTYHGPKRDPVSFVSQGGDRSSPTSEAQGTDVIDAADTNAITTTEVAEQSDAQSAQEGHADPIEPARRKLPKHLRHRLLPSLSKSKGKASEETKKNIPGEVPATQTAANKNVFFWPQRLPQVCPRSRVMTFGYDSDVSKFFGGSANKNDFYDHAGDLLGALVRKRTNAVWIMTPHCYLAC